jgi:predicted acylesterase/phospholipase RssA
MEVINKTKIHFILPGGGVRGSFQAGFIYHLKKLYSNYFDIYRIDGTSVGALNGLALTFEDPEDIRNIWYSIHNIETIFNPWAVKPIWNRLKMLYQGFFQKSLYQNDGLKLIVKNNLSRATTSLLEKYNCVVTNIYTGEYEYINGNNENIEDYITASASPWIISPPLFIHNYMYIDGGLLQTYPIDNVKHSKADMKLLLGSDTTHLNRIGMTGDNIVSYLARIIDVSRINQPNIKKLSKYIEKYNIISIENPLDYAFLEFSNEKIIQGFELGIEAAEVFAKKYFLDSHQKYIKCQ